MDHWGLGAPVQGARCCSQLHKQLFWGWVVYELCVVGGIVLLRSQAQIHELVSAWLVHFSCT